MVQSAAKVFRDAVHVAAGLVDVARARAADHAAALGIDWPVAAGDAMVSSKDALLPPLGDLPAVFA